MKKILLSLIVCILISSLVLAQGNQGENSNAMTGDDVKVEEEVVIEDIEDGEEKKVEEVQIQKQLRTQNKVMIKSYTGGKPKEVEIQQQEGNKIQIKSGKILAQTYMVMNQEQEQNKTKLKVQLSNGKNSEIKIMPDTASETALARLKLKVCSEENGCTIELKEVGQGNETKAAYEVQVQRHFKLLGMFKTKAQVKAQVDAENGEVIQVNKPWWAFLASESEE